MKSKKSFLTISAIIQLIFIALAFINLQATLKSTLDLIPSMYGSFPVDAQVRIKNLIENHGTLYYSILYIIPLLCNLGIIIISLKNKLSSKKGLLITFSSITLILFINLFSLILAIAQLVTCITITKDLAENSKEKKQIPKIEYRKSNKKEIIWAVILILVYFSQFGISQILLHVPSINLRISIIAAFYIICFIVAIFAFKDKLKQDLHLFKNNFKAYMKYIIPRFLIYYIFYFIISIICAIILKNGVSENQKTLEQLPLYVSIPLAVVWAPIVEELVFRGAIGRFIKNNILFILISGIIFGLIHTFDEASIDKVIILGIPYICCGIFLAFIYRKTNNIASSMLVHFINNAFASIISILVTHFILF